MSILVLERLHDAGPLLTLAVVLLVGMLSGHLAKRCHLPGITGQILAGLAIGKIGLDLFGDQALHALQPLTHFALGLMAVTVGAHLNLRRLRNAGKRLFVLLLLEATVTPVLVFLGMKLLGRQSFDLAALFATCAIATAPATVVAVVAESRAKGVFVKTLIAAVALNNMACIFLFEVARAFSTAHTGAQEWNDALADPARQLLIAIGIGGLLAAGMEVIARYVVSPSRLATAAVLSLVLTSGTAAYLGVSPLLACLFLGFVQTNITRTRDKLVDTIFEDFQPAILAVFFTLAGMHLSFEHAAVTGALSVVLFGTRMGGKYLAARWAMQIARAPGVVRKNLGLALVPQAGVAVALVILIQDDPAFADVAETFAGVVLTVVTANEILGPIFLRMALNHSGESNMDRVRLMDFLQEENIVTDFQAQTKHEAIEKLVDLMISSHHLHVDRREILESVLQRESQGSTCLGGGLAVPHGILPGGMPMVGVLGISRDGLDFETPDGHPVHCMVLLGTSAQERDRHLQVLTALARTVGMDTNFQEVLFNAKSPAHASLVLHGEESVGFNYFLEDDD
jgi:mannitol/fructose-specific phosphotransferase system IIA component (Ntr-type)/Kef-type K+ transport system membrane component KefB